MSIKLNNKKSVTIFLLGGTIAMKKSLHSKGVVPKITAKELCSSIPELEQIAHITTRTDRMIASSNLTYKDALWLASEIALLAKEGRMDGAVIIQGTDTLEEMAFILDSLLKTCIPIVVTGAMRSPHMAGADGSANILAAVTAASSQKISRQGAVVVMNDDIHAARYVRKAHTGSVSAFKSFNGGIIGRISEGQVTLFSAVKAREILSLNGEHKFPKIALIKASFGDDDQMIKMIANADYDGVVIEAFGAGHLPETWLHSITQLSDKMPVVLSSRAGEGSIFESTYGYAGAEIDLISRGLIPSGILDGLKSKILLGLLIAENKAVTSEEITAYFKNI